MGSIKKKLTKTLRKITPKEIAPVLPLIAMAVPGLGPVAGNAIFRYGLPQLLTAAASARTSGEINPLNQALAAFASYAAAPDAAGKLTGKEEAFLRSDEGIDFLADKKGIGTTDLALRADPSFAEAVKASGVKSATPGQDFLTGLTRTVGDPIRGLGQGEFNLRNIATVGALGATPAGIDAAKQYQKEQEELAAYEAGLFDDYDQAVQDYIASFTGMQSDPRRLYGLPNLFAAEGGRVGLKEGGNKFFGPAKEGYGMSKKLGAGLASLIGTGAFSMYEFLEPFISGARDAGLFNEGGRVAAQEGGVMATAPGMPPGMQVDGRDGGFIPMGVKEKADDVPAMLSKNEFVMTADAVRAAGGGSVNKGAQRMYDLMNSLEAMV